jgi:3-phenylpropionate/trans-cinnamate dioxygenase ferredoxin subunit
MSQVDAGKLSDLGDGASTVLDVDGTDIALFRDGETVYAIADRCSHAEASLSEGEVFGSEVECPRHGAVFDLTTGNPLSLPATKPNRMFPVTIVDGAIALTVEDEDSP